MRFAVLALAVLLAPPAPPVHAQPTDPAELLPSRTLGYLEVSNPARLSTELTALLRGSALADFPLAMARFREEYPELLGKGWFGEEQILLPLFTGPDTLAEAGRIQGVAFAVTGLDRDGQPEFVGFILAGESNLPTFILRMLMSMPEFRLCPVEEVEGVTLLRHREAVAVKNGPPGEKMLGQEHGIVYAVMPRTIILGSSREVVADVIRRAKGRPAAEPSLAKVAAMRAAAPLRRRAGIFFHADLVALLPSVERLSRLDREFQTLYEQACVLVQPQDVRSCTGSVALENGGFEMLLRLRTAPNPRGPLFALLPDRPVPAAVRPDPPIGHILTLGFPWNDGKRRWQAALDIADGFARLRKQSDPFLPSRLLAAEEERLGLKIGDLLDSLTGASISLMSDDPKEWIPPLVVTCRDESGARAVEAAVPRLARFFGEEVPAARSVRVGERDVRVIKGKSSPFPGPLYWVRDGARVACAHQPDLAVRTVRAKPGGSDEGMPFELGRIRSGALMTWVVDQWMPVGKDEIDTHFPGSTRMLAEVARRFPPGDVKLRRERDTIELRFRLPQLTRASALLADAVVERHLEGALKRNQIPLKGVKPAPAGKPMAAEKDIPPR